MERIVRLKAASGVEYPFCDFQCVCSFDYGRPLYIIQGCYYHDDQNHWMSIECYFEVDDAKNKLFYLKSLLDA